MPPDKLSDGQLALWGSEDNWPREARGRIADDSLRTEYLIEHESCRGVRRSERALSLANLRGIGRPGVC